MIFAQRLQAFGDADALVLDKGTRVSYSGLAALSDSIYSLPGAPRTQGTLIAIECQNALAPVAAYLGALRHGFPALLVDSELAADMREPLYERYAVPHVFRTTGEWKSRTGRTAPLVHPEVALLLSTSGSTGAPKLVRLTRTNLQSNADSIAQYLGLTPGERPITTLPVHYSYGLSVLNSHLNVGATVLLTSEPVTSRPFWEMFRAQQATSLAGVPAIYNILKQMRFERMMLPSLKTMTQAGGRLTPELVRHYGELAKLRSQRFFVMYGQTEATARISYVPPDRLLDKTSSIGIAIPGGQLDLIDSGGQIINEPGIAGELRYRGPNVMFGYATEAAELALPDTQGGVLRTGDLATRDAEGLFHITGRLKRFIKVFGNRIGLDEVEGQLRDAHFDVAVAGRDDLLLVAARGHADLDALANYVSGRYRLHRSAIRVKSVESFPVSAAGKILYGELLSMGEASR